MKKVFLTLLAAFGISATAMASTIDTVVITTADGDETTIALSEKPVVSVTAEALIVTSETATIYYETNKKVTFSFAEAGGIQDLVDNAVNPTFYVDNNTLRVIGLKANSMVALYGINGMMYFNGQTDNEGNIEINIEPYKGIIIVKTASKSIKISKK